MRKVHRDAGGARDLEARLRLGFGLRIGLGFGLGVGFGRGLGFGLGVGFGRGLGLGFGLGLGRALGRALGLDLGRMFCLFTSDLATTLGPLVSEPRLASAIIGAVRLVDAWAIFSLISSRMRESRLPALLPPRTTATR